MTTFEIIRIVCYAIAPLALFYKSQDLYRRGYLCGAILRLFMVLLFVWYMAELTMLNSGIDTRDYRAIATPIVVGLTAVAVVQAMEVRKQHRHQSKNNADNCDGERPWRSK